VFASHARDAGLESLAGVPMRLRRDALCGAATAVLALRDAGCRCIQIEEPTFHFMANTYGKDHEEVQFMVDAFNREVVSCTRSGSSASDDPTAAARTRDPSPETASMPDAIAS